MARQALAASAILAMLGAGTLPALAQRAPDTVPAPRARAASLPQPLASAEALRLRRAFEAQARGDLTAANREIERLEDRRLFGHLLADRLMRPGAEPTHHALQAWLAEYADHPDAPALHELLLRRLPRGAAAPPPPATGEPLEALPELLPEDRPASGASLVRQPALDRAVSARIAEGQHEAALALIAAARQVTPAYAAQLRAEMAQSLFRQGQDEAALRLALDALRHDRLNPVAAHQAGLAAFALARYDQAFHHFERAAHSERASPGQRAAAAYWTARSAVRSRRPAQYVPWMLQAAQEPRTFYGMIARRNLGLPSGLSWDQEVALGTHAHALAETAGGWRALALLQIGQNARAEAELRLLHRRARNNPPVVQGILAVAQARGMTALAATVASTLPAEAGRGRDAARFPLPTLLPPEGFRMDPALLYALALQESRFNPDAVSRAGARGLLQIMPATASYLANDPSLRGEGAQRLHEPGFSLEIGQRYLHYLARHDVVRGDLIRLLAAYNAGPANVSRWLSAAQGRSDPLLFIETIPVAETRLFVQRVLTFSWIYANRMNLPSPSLDALASGYFPSFLDVEQVTAMLRVRPVRFN
jgi:soluble lytic murein transglycosylase-like protein